MKKHFYILTLVFLVFNCSSEDDSSNPNNSAPGPFSITILETRMDGANIEWTESIDINDDAVTYSIYLNDQLISTGGTALSYNFTGLDFETSYDGYILADDGNGGTSEAGFFFVTEPEVTIETLNAVYWLFNSIPEAGGTRNVWGMGFEIPYDENATSYQLEVDEIVYEEGFPFFEGSIYSWTNDTPINDPIYFDEETNVYRVWLLTTSVNTVSLNYDTQYNRVMNISGTAELITSFGNN